MEDSELFNQKANEIMQKHNINELRAKKALPALGGKFVQNKKTVGILDCLEHIDDEESDLEEDQVNHAFTLKKSIGRSTAPGLTVSTAANADS